MGKALSIKILNIDPFFNPTTTLSLLGGPEIVFTYLMLESMIHSLSKMPVKANN